MKAEMPGELVENLRKMADWIRLYEGGPSNEEALLYLAYPSEGGGAR